MGSREFLFVLTLVACLALWFNQGESEPEEAETLRRPQPVASFTPELVEDLPRVSLTSVRVDAGPYPENLEELKIRVECVSSEEMEVGYEDGRPVAFFTVGPDESNAAIAGFVYRSVNETVSGYSPTETRLVRSLAFDLEYDESAIKSNSDEEETSETYRLISVYVWIDGDWRLGTDWLEKPRARQQQSDGVDMGFRVRRIKPNGVGDRSILDAQYEELMGRRASRTP